MAISDVNSTFSLCLFSLMKSLILRAKLAVILRWVLLSLRYLLKEKIS